MQYNSKECTNAVTKSIRKKSVLCQFNFDKYFVFIIFYFRHTF